VSAGEGHLDREQCGCNAAAYVLGALSDDETRAFRGHLRSCAVCREEVAALSVVAAALPAAAPQLTAPSELKRRVMSAVHEEAPAAPARPGRPPGREPFRARRLRPALAGLAVAAAAVIALAVIALAPGGGSGVRVIRAEALSPGASALLRLSGGRAELRIAGMPQSPPGRVYEVWLERAGQPRPTNVLFTVTAAGDATVGVPGSLSGVSEVLVTSERSGGSLVPTRAPVIVAHLS
jgi:anti-sigma-K factor RskA